eukprot:TRINITY_DN8385_c0_g6_i1.p1 TRINITY_DN8385_c0_g6~~TRINITY_DN8385_c0_g6_i1.p1  ORF type:complete len:235 (+),score=13.19 TRINITY_DN8385_c0_g6_i1:73-777(+)
MCIRDRGEILGTIVLPKNLNVLSTRLPKPNYSPSKLVTEQAKSKILKRASKVQKKSKELATINEVSDLQSNCSLDNKRFEVHKAAMKSRPRLPHKIRAKFLLPYNKSYIIFTQFRKKYHKILHEKDTIPKCEHSTPSKIPDLPCLKRISHSVDGAKRHEASRRLIEYYKANPISLKINVLESYTENTGNIHPPSCKPLAGGDDVAMRPRWNPIARAGLAALQRPCHSIRPQWWG